MTPDQPSLFGTPPVAREVQTHITMPAVRAVTPVAQKTAVVATDGSCLQNPGPGGWCWYQDDGCWEAGGETLTTNNRMELLAVLRILQATDANVALLIKADSSYTIDACTKWIHGWKQRGWKTAKGADVKNRDIIEQIDGALEGRTVEFEWVRGHNGHELNEAADVRAFNAATATQQGQTVPTGPGWQHN